MLPMKKMSAYLAGCRILIIDDVESFQQLTRIILKSFGAASVISARSLTEGMHKMNYLGANKTGTLDIDLILMDINLPDGDGIDACQYLSSYAGDHNIPLVVVSGTSDTVTINKALEAGASDYLHKPLARDLLGTRLGMLMAMRAQQLVKYQNELAWDAADDYISGSGNMAETAQTGTDLFMTRQY
jgi:sigma-B regulation protein RsbU (phosphoserine phosphatase)